MPNAMKIGLKTLFMDTAIDVGAKCALLTKWGTKGLCRWLYFIAVRDVAGLSC